MTRPRTAYISVGIALAVTSGASLIWASTTASTSAVVAEPTPSNGARDQAVAGQNAEPTSLPVDSAVSGAAKAIARQQNLPDPSTAAGSQLHICESTIEGWLRSDSTRITTKDAGVTIFVGGWRAGSASTAFRSLKDAAMQCHDVSQTDGTDQILATSNTPDGRRSIAAVRTGDLLTVAIVSSLSADPSPIAEQISNSAPVVLKPRLRGTCANPSSKTSPQDSGRDPYTSEYVGLRVPSNIAVPDNPALEPDQIEAVSQTTADVTWRPPARKPFILLAPFLPPEPAIDLPSDPTAATSQTFKHKPPPKLLDPAEIVAPTEPKPNSKVGDEPDRPRVALTSARAMIPTVDRVGPGCGWAFTQTAVPVVNAEQIAADTRIAMINALVAATAEQGAAMASALQWPERYLTWAIARRAEANWEEYESTLDHAKQDLQEAKQDYKESVDAWKKVPPSPSPEAQAGGAFVAPDTTGTPAPTDPAGTPAPADQTGTVTP